MAKKKSKKNYYDLGLQGPMTLYGTRASYFNGGELMASDLTPEQAQAIQAVGALAQAGGSAIQEGERKNGRPSMAANIGGGALKGLGAGASTGATVGAALGTVVPVVGNVVGGVGGAIIGGALGLLGGAAGGAAKGTRKKRGFREDLMLDRVSEAEEARNAMLGSQNIGLNQVGLGAGTMKYGGSLNKAQVEIEGDELVQFKNGGNAMVDAGPGQLNQLSSGMLKADGPSHEMGGIPISADEGRVFSDVVPKGEKMSPAQKAEEVSKELAKYEERAEKDGTFARKTYEFMKKQFDDKLDKIYADQEALKAESEGVIPTDEMRMGGKLKKYVHGGEDFFSDPMLMGSEGGVNPALALAAFQNQMKRGTVAAPEYSYTGMSNEDILGTSNLAKLYADTTVSDMEEDVMYDEDIVDPLEKETDRLAAKVAKENSTSSTGSTGDYDDIIEKANMYNLLGATPGMAYNFARGVFGKPDKLKLDRLSPQNFEAMKRMAGRTESYNPAAELAAAQSAAGAARKRMSDAAGGDLAAVMRGNLASQSMESSAKSSILGKAEEVNRRERQAARQRILGIMQAQMEDANRATAFNMAQSEKEQMYNRQAEAAQQQHLNALMSQLGALGKGMGQTELYKAQLDALTKK